MPSDHSVFADYFAYGIEAALVSPEQAREWAYSVIEAEEEPPVEIIEVAMAQTETQTNHALRTVKGDRNKELSGRWLLYTLRQELIKNPKQLTNLSLQAVQIARITQNDENIIFELDGLDDELGLATRGIYSTVEQARSELLKALETYGIPYGSDT